MTIDDLRARRSNAIDTLRKIESDRKQLECRFALRGRRPSMADQRTWKMVNAAEDKVRREAVMLNMEVYGKVVGWGEA